MRDPRLAEIGFLMGTERGASAAELADDEHRDMVAALLAQGHVAKTPAGLRITHPGRVHMWNARDALLRDAQFEPFGLRNKTGWERDLYLRLLWARPDSPLSVLFLDLDDFAQVNRSRGHVVGDTVLKTTFSIFKNVVGARGEVYRYADDEVGVLLPDCDHDAAVALAEEIRGATERDVALVAGLNEPQTISVGAATFAEPAEIRVAIELVENLKRRSKRDGKNRITAARWPAAPG